MTDSGQGYQYLFDVFSEEEIWTKALKLYERTEKFLSIEERYKSAHIDENRLEEVLFDYFADINRILQFHKENKGVNDIKKVAYTVSWWVRNAPIQMDRESTYDDKYLNELFGVSMLMSECVSKCWRLAPEEMPAEKEVTFQRLWDFLYYFLRYRLYTAQSLELMLEGFYAGAGVLLPHYITVEVSGDDKSAARIEAVLMENEAVYLSEKDVEILKGGLKVPIEKNVEDTVAEKMKTALEEVGAKVVLK